MRGFAGVSVCLSVLSKEPTDESLTVIRTSNLYQYELFLFFFFLFFFLFRPSRFFSTRLQLPPPPAVVPPCDILVLYT